MIHLLSNVMDNLKYYNLSEFCETASQLFADKDRPDVFARFALTGQLNNTQAVVLPTFNCLRRRDEIVIERDFDSLFGISHDIQFKSSISILPVSRKQDALTQSVHLMHRVMTPDVSPIILSLVDLVLIMSREIKTSLCTLYLTLRLERLESTR